MYARSGSTWLQEFKLLPHISDAYDNFGAAVAIYNEVILVGASMADGDVQNSGAVYFYAPPIMSAANAEALRKSSHGAFAPLTGEVELDAVLATCLILVPAAMASVWWYLRFRKNSVPTDRAPLPTDSQHSSFAPWSAHGVFDDSSRGGSNVRSNSAITRASDRKAKVSDSL